MDCQYCNKIFSVKSSLLHHQKTAKFCIKKRGVVNTETYKCDHCSKLLSTQSRLNTHLKICKIKKNDEKNKEEEKITSHEEKIQSELKDQKDNIIFMRKQLEEKEESLKHYQSMLKDKDNCISNKDEYISKLEELLEKANQTIADIAKQPKTTNNNSDNRVHNQNYITNNFDINDIRKISDMLDNHLTPDVLSRGQEGVADMLKTHLLQTENGDPIYECTDVSRQKFEFRNSDGNIETDPKATKLIRNLGRSGMWDKSHSTGKKLWEKEDGSVNYDAQTVFIPQVTDVLDIDRDSSKFRRHLASITARQRVK